LRATPTLIHTLSLHDALPISFEYSRRKVCRSVRVSDWRAASTWPSCTGVDVRVMGIGPAPSCNTGADAEPGCRSTNMFPSRKMRSEEHTSELQSRVDLVCRLL